MKNKIKLLIIPVIALLLCGCSLKTTEDKKCIEGHTEIKPMFLPGSNGQLKMYMMPYYVCDEWED